MRRALVFGFIAWLAPLAFAASPPAFNPAELPGQGLQQATLSVPTTGLYALWAESPQGAALRLIDRTTGPGAQNGVPGKSNGRINALLEAGEYRVQTQASATGAGSVKLQLRAYQEQHTAPLRLSEFQAVNTQLGDFEQRSYAFTLAEPQPVHFQVGGRALDSVRLWQAGQWLAPSIIQQERVEPLPGQPVTRIQLSALLAPGQYQLTVYGGAALPWTQATEQFPLYLEWGLPKLPESYRGTHTLNPLGSATYLVPARSRYFRLELPTHGEAQMQLSAYQAEQPYTQAKVQRLLKATASPPQLELDLDSPEADAASEEAETEAADPEEATEAAETPETNTSDAETVFDFQQTPASGYYLLQVRGKAGQVYTLQQLPKTQNPYPVQGSGDYWLGLTYTGAASDRLSANAILTATDGTGRATLVKHQAISLDGSRSWRGSFNLDGAFSLLLQVTQNTDYSFEASGAAQTRLRLTPFFADAQTPPPAYRPAGGKWSLAPGFYWLEGEVVEPGLLTLALKPVKPAKKSPTSPLNSLVAVGFPVHLDANQHYNLWLNTQPSVRAGLTLRALPLDLRQPLPLAQAPGEWAAPEIEVTETGVLEAIAEDGTPLELSLAGTARWKTQLNLTPSTPALVKVRHTGADPIAYLLRFTPQRLHAEANASAENLAPAPTLPTLPLNQTLPAQLAPQGRQRYQLEVPSAGIYQLGSQGLLAVNGALRTRLLPELQQARQNGAGRNFVIHSYLNPGAYQLAVEAEGAAHGDYSLRAQPLPLRDGGWLRPGQAAIPAQLAAGEALQLRLRIEAAGPYQLEVLGLNARQFTLRLEDSAGWPVLPPAQTERVETVLAAGDYRLIILPQTLPARLTARLSAVKAPPTLVGHGPHPLPWGSPQTQVWQEPEEGAPRLPDRWQFTLPAPLDVRIGLPAELRAELIRPDAGTTTPVATFNGGQAWEGALQRGAYELRVQALAQNNRLPYRIQLDAQQFAAGQSQTLKLPAELKLRVAGDELLELATWGNTDTRLRLYDAQQRLIAEQDDSALGWNVQLVEALPAGEYRLRLEQASGDSSLGDTPEVQTQLSARAWPVTTANPLKAGERRQLRLNQAYRLPLILGNATALLASAQAGAPLGLGISREGTGAPWLARQTGEQLNLPWLAQPQARYQLWLWPVGGATEASIEWRALPEQTLTTAELREGLPAKHNGWQLYRLDLDAAATLTAPSAPEQLLASSGPEQPFRPLRETHFALGGKLWLLPPGAQTPGAIVLQRLSIPAQTTTLPLALPERAATVLDTGGAPEGIRVVVAETSRGLALIRWLDTTDKPDLPGLSTAAGARYSSASVSLDPTQTQLRLWRGDHEAFALQVGLRQYRYALPLTPVPLTLGQRDIALPPQQALRYRLPNGPLRLNMTLPAHSLAVTSQGAAVRTTHFSGPDAVTESLDTEADTLWLLPLDDRTSSARVRLEPLDKLEMFGSGQILKRTFAEPGIWQVTLRLPEAEQRAQLKLYGLGGVVHYFSGNHTQHDLGQPLLGGGTLRVAHPAGAVAVWLAGSSESLDPWLSSPMQRIDLAKSAQSITLEGKAHTLRFEVDAPRLLHLRAAAPGFAAVRTPDAVVTARAFPDGLAWDLSLAQGVTLLSLHPLHGDRWTGDTLQLATQTPTLLQEGLGAPVLLAPGQQALFRIELPQAAQIGVGVNADPDRITTRLRRADGALLGSGVIQWQSLAAGSYYLELCAPETGTPILARPAVVGLQPPSKLPPADLLRSYLELARTAP